MTWTNMKFAEIRRGKKIIRFDEENERTLSDPNFLFFLPIRVL